MSRAAADDRRSGAGDGDDEVRRDIVRAERGRGEGAGTPATPQRRSEPDGEGERPKSEADDEQADAKENDGEPADKPKGPPIYKRPLFWIIAAVVVIGGTVGGVLFWLHARKHIKTDDAFVAAHITTVSARVAGHVKSVLVDDNQDVKQGDLLVVLDPLDFQQAVNAAEAQASQARSQLVQAKAQLVSSQAAVAQARADVAAAEASASQAQADLDRYAQVQKTDPRAVSKQQVDQATAAARTTRAQLDAAREKQGAAEAQVHVSEAQITSANAAIERTKSDVENAQLQFSYGKITAAEDGQVTNRSVEVGNYVTPGQALMSIVPRKVYVVANYKETQLEKMRVGQPVKIHVDAYDVDLDGHVQSIQAGSGAAFSLLPPENATGNYVKVVQRVPVKITFDKVPEQRLSPGMSVEPNVDVSGVPNSRNPNPRIPE